MTDSPPILAGIDVGGTFTDFVLLQEGRLQVVKVPTTPDDQSRAMRQGLVALGVEQPPDRAETLPQSPAYEVVHGTTTATNALLERRGARTGLLTSQGFRDVLIIGRQNRPHLYQLSQHRPAPLAADGLRFQVQERLAPDGTVLTPLDEEGVRAIAQSLIQADAESLAIVFMFSFRNPAHERRAAQIIQQICPTLPISLSSDILPEYREYERTSTTVINAYVQPLVGRYLQRLADALSTPRIRIMQSNGGAIGLGQAAAQPARLVLSGPAGGVVGAFALAQLAPNPPGAESDLTPPEVKLITFDMGGTSTDVALCPGQIPRTAESDIDGLPLRLPVIDIHTVGAGGGSLAYVDAGGALRVGPHSAGAVPGPAAYGRGGTQATVTDANLVLGRLNPDHFLGGRGQVGLDVDAAQAALSRLGQALGDYSAPAAALGVIQVANATMERALRRVSVEQGYDPRSFTLVPFGGAGPLHACDLAHALGMRRIFIPPSPGVLSALGLLLADVVHDTSHTVLRSVAELLTDPAPLQQLLADQTESVGQVLADEGVVAAQIQASLDMRYVGQSYELTVPLTMPMDQASLSHSVEAFHNLHQQRYGYASPQESVQVVTLRVVGIGPGARPEFPPQPLGESDAQAASTGFTPVWFDRHGPTATQGYDRQRLQPGNQFQGPAMVFQFDTTIVVAPGWAGLVDPFRNLWLLRKEG